MANNINSEEDFIKQDYKDRPFYKTQLDEDSASRDQVNVSLNAEDRAIVNEVKQALNIKSDSKVIRLLLAAGKNVIFSAFSARTWRYLSDKDRVRLSDYERLEELK